MLKLTRIFAWLALTLTVTVCGSSGESAGTDLGPADPRCDSLCADSDMMCTADIATCKSVCKVRVANLSSLCSTCLLEGSNGGSCGGGGTCCPHASFPKGVLDCPAACTVATRSGSAAQNASPRAATVSNLDIWSALRKKSDRSGV